MKNMAVSPDLEELYTLGKKICLESDCHEQLTTKKSQDPPLNRYRTKLKKTGFLVISLDFADQGAFFKRMIASLGQIHTHDQANRSVWDIKVMDNAEDINTYYGRSHLNSTFALHTDGSYEQRTPDYFGLYVLQKDRCGGGKNLLIDSKPLIPLLSKHSVTTLKNSSFRFQVPREFHKGIDFIQAPIFDSENKLRYRREIISDTTLTSIQIAALSEFEHLIYSPSLLQCLELQDNQILLMDNRRYLHARTEIKDPARHLKRIRFFLK